MYVCLENELFYLTERDLGKSLAGALVKHEPANRGQWEVGHSGDWTSQKVNYLACNKPLSSEYKKNK